MFDRKRKKNPTSLSPSPVCIFRSLALNDQHHTLGLFSSFVRSFGFFFLLFSGGRRRELWPPPGAEKTLAALRGGGDICWRKKKKGNNFITFLFSEEKVEEELVRAAMFIQTFARCSLYYERLFFFS